MLELNLDKDQSVCYGIGCSTQDAPAERPSLN
jgi:hypothetical protein